MKCDLACLSTRNNQGVDSVVAANAAMESLADAQPMTGSAKPQFNYRCFTVMTSLTELYTAVHSFK